jgi:glycosyltransferase involved in cell wall biosynthesis
MQRDVLRPSPSTWLITGTDPSHISGGVASALKGYFSALSEVGVSYVFIPTHRADNWKGRFLPWLVALKKATKYAVKTRHRGDICFHYAHMGEWLSIIRQGLLIWWLRLLGGTSLVQIHAVQVEGYLSNPLTKSFFKIFTSGARGLCVLTPYWQKVLQSNNIHKPIFVIPNPAEGHLEACAREPVTGSHQEKLRVLSMTRFVKGKGVDLVIEAMGLLGQNFALTLAGSGPDRARLEDLVKKHSLESKVTFTGWVGPEDKDALLRGCDIFCLPTQNDSFGTCFVEAMAYGKPVVALAWGPIPDVVPSGTAGLLVDNAEPECIAAALRSLASLEVRQSMGAAGKAWVLTHFSRSIVGHLLLDVAQRCLDSG